MKNGGALVRWSELPALLLQRYGWRDEVRVEDPLGSDLRTMRVISHEGAGLLVWPGGAELPFRVMGPAEGRYFRSVEQPSAWAMRKLLLDLQGFAEPRSRRRYQLVAALRFQEAAAPTAWKVASGGSCATLPARGGEGRADVCPGIGGGYDWWVFPVGRGGVAAARGNERDESAARRAAEAAMAALGWRFREAGKRRAFVAASYRLLEARAREAGAGGFAEKEEAGMRNALANGGALMSFTEMDAAFRESGRARRYDAELDVGGDPAVEAAVSDELLGMGVGQVARRGDARVLRRDRDTWVVVAGGAAQEFTLPQVAARYLTLFTERARRSFAWWAVGQSKGDDWVVDVDGPFGTPAEADASAARLRAEGVATVAVVEAADEEAADTAWWLLTRPFAERPVRWLLRYAFCKPGQSVAKTGCTPHKGAQADIRKASKGLAEKEV